MRRLAQMAFLLVLLAAVVPASSLRADRWYSPEPVIGVIDSGRRADDARKIGVTWDRALFLWQEIQPNGPGDWEMDSYLDRSGLRQSLASGVPLTAVVQGTPGWAATRPADGVGSVPAFLSTPYTDPRNAFAQFMRRMTEQFQGRIHAWIIWNEPDFLKGKPGEWWTWDGDSADFVPLMRSAYHAVKSVDPSATVVFPATTYFIDVVNGRELFLTRYLADAAKDPEAAKYGFYMDAVGVNLYCSLDAIYQVQWRYAQAMAKQGLVKPLWLTETNCPVYDDRTMTLDPQGRVSSLDQASYLVQAIALARSAGYQRIGWYGMVDHDPASGIVDRYGLLRSDGTPRPAMYAMSVLSRYLNDPDQVVRFSPVGQREGLGGWDVWRVVVEDVRLRRRIQVLWRGVEGPDIVRAAATGSSAYIMDIYGGRVDLTANGRDWEVPMPPARAARRTDPPGFQSGTPIYLVEEGVRLSFPLESPALTTVPRNSSRRPGV